MHFAWPGQGQIVPADEGYKWAGRLDVVVEPPAITLFLPCLAIKSLSQVVTAANDMP